MSVINSVNYIPSLQLNDRDLSNTRTIRDEMGRVWEITIPAGFDDSLQHYYLSQIPRNMGLKVGDMLDVQVGEQSTDKVHFTVERNGTAVTEGDITSLPQEKKLEDLHRFIKNLPGAIAPTSLRKAAD